MATDPKPVNPAEGVLGAIPGGGVSVSFTTGLPADYVSPTGQLPYLQKDPKTGKITSRFYDIRNDPRVLLNSLNETERKKILTGLATKISGYDPGTGFEDKDYSAFGDLLTYANLTGKPYFQAYNEFMQRVPNSSYVKKAPSIRVTSTDDVKTLVRRSSRELLGYEIDDMTANRIAGGFRQMEIVEGQRQAAGGVYEAATDPSVFAEQKILEQFAPQAQSFAAGNLASIMDQSIKALGA
jgi:hypothetical protein